MSSIDPQRIGDWAREEGFLLVGVSPAAPPPHFAQLQEWLASGHHGDMKYLEANLPLRADPRILHPGSRTIVTVAMSYRPPSQLLPSAHISAFALGVDYHKLIRKRLARLGRRIEAHLGPGTCQPRACVDSAPLLERDFAAASGLGWIAKNTHLVSPCFGSMLFLGVLLVGHELEPLGQPLADSCKQCQLCLTACPAQALLAPRLLDARRCISYLTIELQGAIPHELRPAIGSRLFGCDRCQDVCPFNRTAQIPDNSPFQPREELLWLTPERALPLSQAEFDRLTRGTSLRRLGRARLARNAAIALANSQDDRHLEILEAALLQDLSPLVRGHAAWALARLPTSKSRKTLSEARQREFHLEVLAEIELALESSSRDH